MFTSDILQYIALQNASFRQVITARNFFRIMFLHFKSQKVFLKTYTANYKFVRDIENEDITRSPKFF